MKDVQHAVFPWKPALGVAVLLAALGGCSKGPKVQPAGPSIDDFCFDADGDGYGTGCEDGPDCNDSDANVFEGCGECDTPETGCECELGTPPVECVGSMEHGENSFVCSGGTRYCRDGYWSACVELVSFETTVPKALERVVDREPSSQRKHNGVRKQGMDAGAGDTMLVECGACQPSCFLTDEPISSGLASDGGLLFSDGGLTLPEWSPTDASADGCAVDDSDCDGIPDSIDTWEGGAPTDSDYDTLYFQLDPGDSGGATLDIDFQLRRADIYFLLDNTSSMAGEISNLRSTLQTGSFLTGSDATDPCKTDPALPDGFDYSSRKSGGVLGNIACLMPGTQFGAGYYGDVPFAYVGSGLSGWLNGMDGRGQHQAYAVPYYHLQDSTDQFGDVQDALNQVSVAPDGAELPEGAMFAIHSLATGDQLYTGWDRMGIPPRPAASCPDGTFGAGCMREDALPIVINLSDAAFNNGPYLEEWSIIGQFLAIFDGDGDSVNDEFCYSQSEYQCSGLIQCLLSFITSFIGSLLCILGFGLGLPGLTRPDFPIDVPSSRAAVASQGTTAAYISTYPYTNEDTDSALDLGSLSYPSGGLIGSLDGELLTFTGDTRNMSADVDVASMGCGTLGTGNDAAFAFTLDTPQTVTISAQGTSFESTLSLLSGTSIVQVGDSGSANDGPASAFAVNGGSPLPAEFNRLLSGSTTSLRGDIPWSVFGSSCQTGGSTYAADALYRFTPSTSGTVQIRGGGTSAPMAVALFDEEPRVPITTDLPNNASMDIIGAFGGVDISDRDYTYANGNNGVADIDNDYGAAIFETFGCSVDENGKDAVIDFSVSRAGTQVEITSGSADLTGAADFDHALALVRRSGTGLPTSPTTVLSTAGATYETARALDPQSTLLNNWYRYRGTLSGTGDDYDDLELGGIAPSVCDVHDNANDAVYEMTLTSPQMVEISASAATFDPIVSLHKDFIGCVSASGSTNAALNGDDRAPGEDLGELDYASLTTITGTTNGFGNHYSASQGWGAGAMSCISSWSSHDDAPDVVYQFTLNSTHNLSISVNAPSDARSIGVFRSLVDNGNYNRIGCDSGSSGVQSISARDYTAGTYYVVVKAGSGSGNGDNYTLTIANNNPDTFSLCPNSLNGTTESALPGTAYHLPIQARNLGDLAGVELLTLAGNLSSSTTAGTNPSCGAGGRKAWFKFTPSENTTLEFTTAGKTNNAMQMTLALFSGSAASLSQRACNGASGAAPGASSTLTASVTAGTEYHLLVQGIGTGLGEGAFEVTVNDAINGGLNDPFVDCAEETSSIAEYLEAGTYYVTVSSPTATTSGSFNLDIKMGDVAADLGGAMLACRQDNVASRQSLISEPLAVGDYSVIVRGVDAADLGNFGVRIRDTAASSSSGSVACHEAQLAGGTEDITYPVVAGQEYFLAVRGEEATDEGNYEINLYNAPVGTSLAMEHCFSSSGDRVDGQPQVTLPLDAGDYQVVIAGANASESGPFQLTIGNRSLSSSLAWNAPNYLGTDGTGTTNGVLKAMTDREMRVVNVLSGSAFSIFSVSFGRDEQAWSQALTIADDTNTMDTSGNPLMVHANANGSGTGTFIVNAVQELVNTLQMDVTLRLNYLDDAPSSSGGFDFLVEAVGGECGGVVDTTGNGTPDTHRNCNPGAVPQFNVTFTNPADDPVPANETADDASGGYHMAVDVIGDGRYLIDQIPVYIIPEVLVPGPGGPATGTVSQDTAATGCIDTERPVWSGLSWEADLPADTQLTFRMCAADDAADLDGCDMRTLAVVTADGTACSGHGDCTNGFCQAGACQYPRSGDDECDDDSDCGVNGTCLTASGACVWNSPTIDPRPALVPGMQGLTNARLQIELRTNNNQSAAPTFYDYELSYTCSPFE